MITQGPRADLGGDHTKNRCNHCPSPPTNQQSQNTLIVADSSNRRTHRHHRSRSQSTLSLHPLTSPAYSTLYLPTYPPRCRHTRRRNGFQGRRFYEIVKDEVTPPPPTLEEWDGQPSTPSDLSDDEDLIREWRWENRAPRFGGKPLPEDDDVDNGDPGDGLGAMAVRSKAGDGEGGDDEGGDSEGSDDDDDESGE